MSGKRYAEELKIEAVKRVTEGGYLVSEVVARLGVSVHSLYQWVKLVCRKPSGCRHARREMSCDGSRRS